MSVIDDMFESDYTDIAPEVFYSDAIGFSGDDEMTAHFFRELYTRYPVRRVRAPRRSPYREVADTDVSKLTGVEETTWDKI